jgi:AraC-like DNA-binding protein
MENDLSLVEMAQSVGLSTAHFARMFRKSTGETPHQFVLRQRLERTKAMLRAADARVLDVDVACGSKAQQDFAQVFRDACRVSPTEYRQDFLGWAVTGVSESRPEHRHACDLWSVSQIVPVMGCLFTSFLRSSSVRHWLLIAPCIPLQHCRLHQQF